MLSKINPLKKKKNKEDNISPKSANIFKTTSNKIIDAIVPQNINTYPDDHIKIINNTTVYARTLYVRAIPKNATFANTFEGILKFPNSNVMVYVNPIETGRAIKDLDDDINAIEAERLEAQKDGVINKERKMAGKRAEAEALANSIDAGDNKLYWIAIFITLYAKSLDELDKMSAEIRDIANKKSIQLVSCYRYHDQGYQICSPVGEIPKPLIQLSESNYWHLVDKHALATLFHYTTSDFTHKKGALLGRNIYTGRHVFYNLFDESLRAYNAVITGVTGSGKSVILKKIIADHIDMGCKAIGMDSDSPDARGEYSKLAEKYNGINIEIHSKSKTILNPFDINIEYVYDEVTQTEKEDLNLTAKILDVTNVLLTMARGNNREDKTINEITRQIIQEAVTAEYEALGIYNGQPESLYTTGAVLEKGKLTSGKVRKKMPTISSWYKRICEDAQKNTNETYKYHYDYLTKVMQDWTVNGTRPYFDGQSTHNFDTSIPFINLDIHTLHPTYERPIAQIICMIKIWEDYIKKNSENPFEAEQIIVNFDEVHLIIKNDIYPEARELLVDMYARIRKKNGAVITSTQEITTFNKYESTKSIITNAETKIIGLQDILLAKEVQEILGLTDSETSAITSFTEPGMFLVRNRNRKIFVKSDFLDIEKPVMETNRKKLDALKRKEQMERMKKKELPV